MKRLFWLALGITLGVMIMRKISAAAQKLTPQGMASGIGAGLSDLASAIGEFGADVRAAMADREAELRASTGLDGRLGKPDTGPGGPGGPGGPAARRPGPRPA